MYSVYELDPFPSFTNFLIFKYFDWVLGFTTCSHEIWKQLGQRLNKSKRHRWSWTSSHTVHSKRGSIEVVNSSMHFLACLYGTKHCFCGCENSPGYTMVWAQDKFRSRVQHPSYSSVTSSTKSLLPLHVYIVSELTQNSLMLAYACVCAHRYSEDVLPNGMFISYVHNSWKQSIATQLNQKCESTTECVDCVREVIYIPYIHLLNNYARKWVISGHSFAELAYK